MESVTALYKELRAPVFRFLLRMGCDAATAEELTQESFLQALLALPRFRGESGVRTWLFAIARNLYLKQMRQAKRPVPIPDGLPSPAPDPQAEAEARQRRDWLHAALAELPELQRTVLVLREYEELSFAEIGAIVERTEVWCRVTAFRARQQLKESYLRLSGGESL